MGLLQENFIREFCAAWGDGSAQSRPQVDKILSMLAEDAIWQLWVPGGPVIRGRAALRREIERQMSYTSHNLCTIRHMVSSDTLVMTERDDYAVSSGKPMPHSMVAVYELDGQGLIKAWREYLDTADLAKKKGVALDHVGGPGLGEALSNFWRSGCNR
ncbi:nuclear transport factor 2 family protein [Ectopseudomonas mendocina]|uniref:Nuclear transport factor 2 family protein n=1 Tax=Ectopseudomonas mendocina TaxID=300 RepID=A0ABD7RRJ0_ECTME|nr:MULTISPECIES: nuclear transport factor 2 family protein [Pseudomonas]MPT16757.1 nuclear transport factor 2 family protein [Pseudomonas sp.]TRO11915.1 nuclear transport factor 2 family protein [Pseudomonas mendocina]TRO13889.1 nuclear transport factor 2 family protein [Pseudomonas mendocina]WJH57015.1 nuclear transport factor 2 family protein [Pseudomonas guguanensis]